MVKVRISPHSCPTLAIAFFKKNFVVIILVGVKKYPLVALIYISLMANNVEPFPVLTGHLHTHSLKLLPKNLEPY